MAVKKEHLLHVREGEDGVFLTCTFLRVILNCINLW